MKRAFNFFCVLTLTVLMGCLNRNNVSNPDLSKIHINQNFLRFDQDLFNSDFEKLPDSIHFFKKKYGEFFDIFNLKVIKVGDASNPAYPDLLKGFVTDYNMHQVFAAIEKEYKNTDSLKTQINNIFSHYKYYFPKMPVPSIITFVSGFNQSMVTTDTILAIGLDKFLGADCPFYEHLGTPKYARTFMKKSQIPVDCAKAWAFTQFPISDSGSNLLANIVYQGKVAYFTQLLIPQAEDSTIIGMTKSQMEWCKSNENQMWTFLVENKLLFQSDFMLINKFVGEGPFTKDFGRTSPAKAVIWIGWHIVSEYMRNNKNLSLETLMHENDFQKILRLSKYRP